MARKICMLEIDDSLVVGQSDDDMLDEVLADPRLKKLLVLAFLEIENRLVSLENTVDLLSPPKPERTADQIRRWFKNKLKQAEVK